MISLALVLLAGAGAIWLRTGPQPAAGATVSPGRFPVVGVPLEAVLPVLLVAGFVIFLQLFQRGVWQALIVALAALSFGAVFWAQAHTINIHDRYFGLAQMALNVAGHLIAFLLFCAIYGLKTRALYSASAVGMVSTLLVYEMLSRDASWHKALALPVEGRRTTLALLSLSAGLVLSELTWGLNYWAALTTLIGGAFLLVMFYVIYGIVSHYVDHKLTRQTLFEFGVVGTLGIAAIFVSAFWT